MRRESSSYKPNCQRWRREAAIMMYKVHTSIARMTVFVMVSVLASLMPTNRLLAQSAKTADENAMALPIYPPSTGDFDEMKRARLVRIIVPFSKTIYFIDKGMERGTAAEAGREFE